MERTFTPDQRQLAALGFEIDREPYPVPKLTIEDARGLSRSLSDLQGGWVILEFWGAFCEPCRSAMPALQRLSICGIGEHVTILPVCVDADDAGSAQEILSQIAPGLTAYVESAGIGIAQFDVQALPMTWLVDPEGQVRATHVGCIDWDSQSVREAFEAMLAGSGFIRPVWTVTDCAGAPSHALYDSDSESLFVSQISGEGDKKDGVGAVSRLDLNGKVLKCQWVKGLDAPKGLGRHKQRLWVSDIDRLICVEIPTGSVVKIIPIPGAKFLTGVAIDGEGTVYVADMLTSKIHRYQDAKLSTVAAGDDLESPAGLILEDNLLIFAAWGLTTDYTTRVTGRLLSLDVKDPTPKAIAARPVGNLYGVASDGRDGYLVSDWCTGRVLHFVKGEEPRQLLQLPRGSAGIEYVPIVKLLVVPELTQNRISAYDLSLLLKP